VIAVIPVAPVSAVAATEEDDDVGNKGCDVDVDETSASVTADPCCNELESNVL
jgi:hypothetical protein